jgi:NAD(P)H-quinone oxidoreductase subunit 5
MPSWSSGSFIFGTGNLEVIFQEIKSSISLGSVNGSLEAVGLLLAFAALLKSAQFPTHGWLIEVMETPTPVSALLHAGILNAGPFLLIRMAYVMEASTYAPLLIIAIGGFTAIFASVAFLTQTSIKTALGYSSVAHMGFSLMVCGLGAYPVAMLHLVAHSFYKAHSFLSSGSIIDLKRASKVKKANRTGSPFKIAFGIVLALLVYIGFSILWGIDLQKDVALLAIGSIIVMGLATIFTAALDSDGSFKLMLRASILAIIVAAAFFTLESGMHLILSSQLPEIVGLSFIETILMSILLLAFSVVVFIQMLAPVLSATPMYRNLAIHFRNGLYANAIFDRIVGALHIQRPENSSSESEEIERLQQFENFEIKRLEEQMA